MLIIPEKGTVGSEEHPRPCGVQRQLNEKDGTPHRYLYPYGFSFHTPFAAINISMAARSHQVNRMGTFGFRMNTNDNSHFENTPKKASEPNRIRPLGRFAVRTS
jgi:hypothetical protein